MGVQTIEVQPKRVGKKILYNIWTSFLHICVDEAFVNSFPNRQWR